jgi:hypothetical protein
VLYTDAAIRDRDFIDIDKDDHLEAEIVDKREEVR